MTASTFYIASSRDGLTDVRRLAAHLEAIGMRWAFDWPAHFEHTCSAETCGVPGRVDLAAREIVGVANCDLFVGIGRMGRGTHVELGVALLSASSFNALKMVVLVGVDKADSVFYEFSMVVHCSTVDEVIAMVRP